jgi:hypothetical protein
MRRDLILKSLLSRVTTDVQLYKYQINNNTNNNNNIYSGSSTHRSVFQRGPVIYIYILYMVNYTMLI